MIINGKEVKRLPRKVKKELKKNLPKMGIMWQINTHFKKTKKLYAPLTKDRLKSMLEDISLEMSKEVAPSFVMWQGCRKYGMIERSSFTRYSCDDPLCKTCRDFDRVLDEGMKKEAAKYLKKHE